jgi:hypothetical protein
LAGEGLGRGNADLGARERRQHDIGFTRNGGFAHIDDGKNVLPLPAAIAERGERVGGLARLRHEQRGPAGIKHRLAIAELRGDIDVDRKPRPALEPIFGDQAGIEGGAAGRQRDAGQLGKVQRQRRYVYAIGREVDVSRERVADHLGLLVNFLGHEMAVIALVDEKRRGERAGDRALDRAAVAAANGDAFARQHRPIAVFKIGDGIGERRERNGVGADEHLAIAKTDGERAALPRHDHQIVAAAEDHGERERALQVAQRVEGRSHRVVAGLEFAGDEMGDDLGICVAGEHRAFGDQLLFQLAEILDDAVMHYRDEIGHMRMRVGLDRLAVSGPARMADAGVAGERMALKHVLEIAQLAFGAPAAELTVFHGGDARGIITAIFETLQRVDQLLSNGCLAEDANDAAHGLLPHALAIS